MHRYFVPRLILYYITLSLITSNWSCEERWGETLVLYLHFSAHHQESFLDISKLTRNTILRNITSCLVNNTVHHFMELKSSVFMTGLDLRDIYSSVDISIDSVSLLQLCMHRVSKYIVYTGCFYTFNYFNGKFPCSIYGTRYS